MMSSESPSFFLSYRLHPRASFLAPPSSHCHTTPVNMSIDFPQVITQLQRMVSESAGQAAERARRLEHAIALWEAYTGRESELAGRLKEGELSWPVAEPLESWQAIRPAAPLPPS